MALKMTDECIHGGVCKQECPDNVIYEERHSGTGQKAPSLPRWNMLLKPKAE